MNLVTYTVNGELFTEYAKAIEASSALKCGIKKSYIEFDNMESLEAYMAAHKENNGKLSEQVG